MLVQWYLGNINLFGIFQELLVVFFYRKFAWVLVAQFIIVREVNFCHCELSKKTRQPHTSFYLCHLRISLCHSRASGNPSLAFSFYSSTHSTIYSYLFLSTTQQFNTSTLFPLTHLPIHSFTLISTIQPCIWFSSYSSPITDYLLLYVAND